MNSPAEEALILAALAGETAAYGELVALYQQRLYWTAYRMLGDHHEARDAAQEALIRGWERLESFDRSRRFYTWIYRVLVNLVVDLLRARSRRAGPLTTTEIDDGRDGPETGLLGDELRAEVWSALSEVPAQYRALLILRDVEGLSGKEISVASGVTHGTVRWRIHRARKLFREIWERQRTGSGRSEP